MLSDFKKFILRGNVVDLAVAVVIGAAFGALVTAFVKDFIAPVVALVLGKNSFESVTLWVFKVGDFVMALLGFLIIAAVVYFFVVRPVNWAIERSRTQPPADPTTKKCARCLSEVPLAATRCAYCTSDLEAA